MVNKYIQELIAQGENQHLDFKYEVSDAKKIARTFSAFANTGGGKLLIGVKDNGVIRGIETDEEAYMLDAAANFYCKPRVEYRLKDWQVEGKNLLEVTILESAEKPHLAPWKENLWRAFVRVEDENYVADTIQVAVWKNQRNEKATLIKYNQVEKKLLSFLEKNGEITLKDFCKLCQVKYPVARKILINFVTVGVLNIQHSDKTAKYRLAR